MAKWQIVLGIFSCIFTVSFSGSAMAGDACRKAFISSPWVVEFSDGSANGYQFKQDVKDGDTQFSYAPVRPEASSTGMYSGGSARSGTLKKLKRKSLCKRIAKLENNPEIVGGSRGKGTGLFKITTPSGIRTFIVEQSKPLERFQKFLATIQ